MDNKKKPQTTLKEVRKKMKKLTLAEKKQIKQTETKEKEKKESNKQKITQRVKVSVNVPSSYSQPQSKNFPNSFANTEQTTLLKSINEQLKQKNQPVSTASQTFNIPQPRRTESETQTQQPRRMEEETQTQQPRRTESETQTQQPTRIEPEPQSQQPTRIEPEPQSQQPEEEDNSYEVLQEGLNQTRLELERKLKERLPPQFSENITSPPIPIIKSKPAEEIPIISKPAEKSAMTLIEQLKQKQEKEKEKEPKTAEDIQVMEEEIQQAKINPNKKRLTEEERKQKAEEKRLINQENERLAELEQRRKINEAENKIQLERERGFIELLKNTDIGEQKDLQEAYDRGFLTHKAIRDKLKKLKYPVKKINSIFSGEKQL